MEKVDYTELLASMGKEPLIKKYKANITLEISSTDFDTAAETLELLVSHFDRFDDIEVIESFLNGVENDKLH